MSGIWKPFSVHEYRRPWQISRLIRQIGRDIKWGHQRIWKGFCAFDLYSIDSWFMAIMPKMLKEFKETRHGSPVLSGEDEGGWDVHEEWDKILNRMIFLLGEMDETSCSEQNLYKELYFEAIDKLPKGPAQKNPDGMWYVRIPQLSDYPEYRELEKNYHAQEERLEKYRLACKKEFFELFSTHFYNLWD